MKTVKNNQNPVWNYNVKFDIHKEILISVFDEDIGKDDPLGNSKLNVAELIKKQRAVEKWITLKDCKPGEILISAEFLDPSHSGTETTSVVPRQSLVSDEDDDGFESEALPPTPWSVIVNQPNHPSDPIPPDHSMKKLWR